MMGMILQPTPPALLPGVGVSAVWEMRFWLHIMSAHARIIRGGLDVTDERIFRYVDCLGAGIDSMLAEVQSACPPFSPGQVERLIAEANQRVVPLRELKRDLAALVRQCRINIQLPADMLEHIRREADFFLGIINGLVGWPVASRSDLEVPAPPGEENCPANLAPRTLIPCLGRMAPHVLMDEVMFFADINGEHGVVLSLFFRPVVQDQLAQDVAALGEVSLGLFREMTQARLMGATLVDMRPLIVRAREAASAWIGHLRCLEDAVGRCSVPTGQVNFPYHLLHHMENEGLYSIELMDMALAMTQG